MSRPQRSVAELAAELQKALDTSLAQNERLADQIKEFEARAKHAELRARETQEKLRILESLKTKEYQTVVTELFEGPSRRAVRLTLLVAVASIVISLAQTVISSIYASRANAAAVVSFSDSLRSQLQEDISLSASQTKKDVNRIVADMQRDGTTEAKALDVQPGVPVNAVIGSNEDKYYRIAVPENASHFDVTLTYSAPAHAHIAVHHADATTRPTEFGQRYVTREQCVNGHGGSPDRCVFEDPRPGSWIVRVHGFAPDKLSAKSGSRPSSVSQSSAAAPSLKTPSVTPRSTFRLVATIA